MKKWRQLLAALAIIAMLAPVTGVGEDAAAVPEASETAAAEGAAEDIAEEVPQEAGLLDLDENGAAVKAAEGHTAQFFEQTINPADRAPTFSMSVGDTLRIRVADAVVTDWKPARKNIVTYSSGTDAAGDYTDFKADAECKKLKLTATITGNKKKKASLNLVITDPYIPTGVEFKPDMPASVLVGTILPLADWVQPVPEDAGKAFTYKASGAAKVTKDGVLTAAKAGKAKITVTASKNKKAKATFALTVLANKVEKLSGKPGSGDFGAIQGHWTLWPVSAAVGKKGLDCQFYVLNATGEKVTQIEDLELTVAVGLKSNVVARYSNVGGKALKASVARDKSKLIKLTLPIVADMTGVSLPAARETGTLFFGINQDSATLKSRKGAYSFVATQFPTVDLVKSVALSQAEATLNVGETLTLTAEVTPAYADDPTLVWSTSDAAVATVNNGVVTAVGGGTATITATAADGGGAGASCAVTVIAPEPPTIPVTGVALSPTSANLEIGGTLTLTATVTPADATNPALAWTSDDPLVAAVENGVVTALAAGKATITATATDGSGVKAACAVTVVDGVISGDFVVRDGAVTGYVGAGGKIELPKKDDAGATIVEIAANAFKGNADITGVVIPDGVTVIGASAFEDCAALERAEIPGSVGTVGKGAFKNCSKLRNVVTVR